MVNKSTIMDKMDSLMDYQQALNNAINFLENKGLTWEFIHEFLPEDDRVRMQKFVETGE